MSSSSGISMAKHPKAMPIEKPRALPIEHVQPKVEAVVFDHFEAHLPPTPPPSPVNGKMPRIYTVERITKLMQFDPSIFNFKK